MRINKATASFGKLENESLSFHPGLNIIYAPNENGKSTWCAFIRAMLYGVDSSERSRAGYLPDKLRYAPWSGAPMEGSMELTADKCDITITRTTRAKSAPMREFSATYTGSNFAESCARAASEVKIRTKTPGSSTMSSVQEKAYAVLAMKVYRRVCFTRPYFPAP